MRLFCSCCQRPASLYNVLIVVGFPIITIVLVPKAGLEPARISTVDFESTASTDFATSALKGMRKRCGLYLSRAAMQATTRETRAKCPKPALPSVQLRHRQPNHPRRLLLRQRQHLGPHLLHHIAGELLLPAAFSGICSNWMSSPYLSASAFIIGRTSSTAASRSPGVTVWRFCRRPRASCRRRPACAVPSGLYPACASG